MNSSRTVEDRNTFKKLKEQEIKWIKEALQNNCEGCPLSALCAGAAKKDSEQYGKVKQTCKEFLGEHIVFITENNI